jgi:hypothetical protein
VSGSCRWDAWLEGVQSLACGGAHPRKKRRRCGDIVVTKMSSSLKYSLRAGNQSRPSASAGGCPIVYGGGKNCFVGRHDDGLRKHNFGSTLDIDFKRVLRLRGGGGSDGGGPNEAQPTEASKDKPSRSRTGLRSQALRESSLGREGGHESLLTTEEPSALTSRANSAGHGVNQDMDPYVRLTRLSESDSSLASMKTVTSKGSAADSGSQGKY